ncbi:phosphate signaling complex protein PhoU [Breznakia sp. OttesenSCG-928-G09]|nr:phosphate signaling complex protein PhoU [Breznakia sp. OttesenSCG-928-G09]
MIKLDRKLKKLETSVIHMGEQVIGQHRRCAQVLTNYDDTLAQQIVDNDEIINNYEVNINDQAIADIVLLRPVATDLRRVLVAIKIASDLERIGDYAKGLANYILKNENEEEYHSLLNHAVIMENKLIQILQDVMKCYKDKDAQCAYEIPKQDEELNKLLREFRHKLVAEKNPNLRHVFYLSNLFRNIERAGDHSVNICEHIVYLCKGIQYDFDKVSQ